MSLPNKGTNPPASPPRVLTTQYRLAFARHARSEKTLPAGRDHRQGRPRMIAKHSRSDCGAKSGPQFHPGCTQLVAVPRGASHHLARNLTKRRGIEHLAGQAGHPISEAPAANGSIGSGYDPDWWPVARRWATRAAYLRSSLVEACFHQSMTDLVEIALVYDCGTSDYVGIRHHAIVEIRAGKHHRQVAL